VSHSAEYSKGHTRLKFQKCNSENYVIIRFGYSVMDISNLISYKKLINEKKEYTKFFFVSSHSATSNYTHYPIANSVYINKCSLHIHTQPMHLGALNDGHKAVKWATDYFLKAHTAPNEFYGQVGQGELDHAFWGRPEDMTMARPAFKIDTSRPGKLASRSFFPQLCFSYPQENQQHVQNISRILSSESFTSKRVHRLCDSRHSILYVFILSTAITKGL